MLDPFCVHLPKWHPKRIGMKGYVRLVEMGARLFYDVTELPYQEVSPLPQVGNTGSVPMSVTPLQLAYLLRAVEVTENLEGVVAELGSFEGRTSAALARHTDRFVCAVDPYYEGWPPAVRALREFRKNTAELDNVKLERKSSGQAASAWPYGSISVLFIDSQHDFANSLFDFRQWLPLTCENALIAFHDVDNQSCPGTRVAAWMAARNLPVWAHIDNLLILQNVTR